MVDGTIEVQIFISNGQIGDADHVERLFANHTLDL